MLQYIKGGMAVKICFPEMNDQCRKAYLLGYRAGYQDGLDQKIRGAETIPADPIEILSLSTRACNCLRFAGLRYVSEVAALPAEKIYKMRNLGEVTANEIALALHKYGICGTDWELFLL